MVKARAAAQQTSAPPAMQMTNPVTAIVIGAGARGSIYAGYAGQFPNELKIVGVAEPIDYRNEAMAAAHGIGKDMRWDTWEHVFQRGKCADAVIISTPDDLHYGPAMAALELGYDLLLEKVVAQEWEQCRDILLKTRETNRIVAVCHVLRYTPYFREMKRVLESGQIGDIVSVQHLEPVEHIHMSHSFVRGNWSNSRKSNPMILSKSCHDTDILRWLIGKPSRRISSFGSLSLFRPDRAPVGAPRRCTDGCPVEAECPFSALKVYLEPDSPWAAYLVTADRSEAGLRKALQDGPYGRCVYYCDNDAVDHQVTNIEFEDGVTAAFSLEGLTSYGGRRTRITGTRGDLTGDELTLSVFDFATRKTCEWTQPTQQSGHGGGDFGLVHDFVRAVAGQDASILSSTIDASMESHLMGFMAEKSRLNHGEVQEIMF